MSIDYQTPLFELHGPSGERWSLWADGRALGFPEGTILVNRAAPLIHAQLAALANEKRRWDGVEGYLQCVVDVSMSRNNSEALAAELLEQIRGPGVGRLSL